MKKTNLLKVIMLVMIISVVFFGTTVNASGFNDITNALNGNEANTDTNTNNEEEPTTNNEDNTSALIPDNTEEDEAKENLPEAGLESSLPVIALIVVAIISAVFAFKKINEYKNI